MLATLRKTFSVYTLLSLLVLSQAAILVFVHRFGNQGVDTICGSVLGFLAVLSIVGHTWLASLTITVPANVYSILQSVNTVLTTLLGFSGLITQYVGSATPTLTPYVATILMGASLVTGFFANLFKTSSALRAQRQSLSLASVGVRAR